MVVATEEAAGPTTLTNDPATRVQVPKAPAPLTVHDFRDGGGGGRRVIISGRRRRGSRVVASSLQMLP